MKWIRRLSLLVTGLLLCGIFISTAAVLILDETDYKHLLSWGAERFLGSQLIIEAPINVDISNNLLFSTGGITLKANDDSYRLSAGELHASFRLDSYLTTGSFQLNSLKLSDVDLEVSETASGGGDPATIDIPPLVINQVQISNLQFAYRELPPGTLHRFTLAELTIGELGERQPISLNGLDAAAETRDGLKLAFGGNAVLHPAGHKLTQNDAGLAVRFSAPTLAAANLIGLEGIPKLGPVSGSLALALGMDAIAIYNADISIGNRKKIRFLLKGDAGYLPLTDTTKLSGLNLQVDVQTVEFARLGELLGYRLPELGQTRLTGRLESTKTELQFRGARLEVGAAGQPTIRANGKVTTQLQKGSTINAVFDIAVADLVDTFLGRLPENLGRLEGEVEISDLDGSWGIERFDLATTESKLYQLKLSGRYDDLVNYDEASINLNATVDNPQKLGESLGLDLTGIKGYRTQGLLTADKGRLSFQGNTTIGSTSSTTEISGYLKEGKPILSGSMEIPVLYLADFGIGSENTDITTEPAEVRPSSPHVFSREPLNTEFLNAFDLDLALSIEEVKSGELAIDSVKGELSLRNGHLSIAPLRLMFEGGNTDINLDIKAADVPEYRLAVTADDVTLGPLMAQVQDDVPIHGYSNIHLDLRASGHSPHDLVSNLSGSASLGLENARIPNHYVKLLSVDVLGWVLSKSVSMDSYSNLNCVVVAFDISAGEVKSEALITDGPNLNIGGHINMNIGEETLDIVLLPTEKRSLFSSISPVHIKGPMRDPVITAIPTRAALQEIGSMALLPGVMIPLYGVKQLWGLLDDGDKIGDGCANIDELREAAKK